VVSAPFVSPEARNRYAWQRFTAQVLRGKNFHWHVSSSLGHSYTVIYLKLDNPICDEICVLQTIVDSYILSLDVKPINDHLDHVEVHHTSNDIDEVMARLALAVMLYQ
jgi:hypothetical protein